MLCPFFRTAAATLLLLGASAHSARAGVWLLFTDEDATPTSANVAPGSAFSVKLKLASSTTNASDKVAGVDYYLQSAGPQAGVFTLTNRDTTGPLNDPLFDNDTVLAPENARLNPRTVRDLGASLTSMASPIANNTTPSFNPAQVATHTLAVAALAAPGSYTLSIYNNPDTGYVDADYNDQTFSTATPPGTLKTTFAVKICQYGDADLDGAVGFTDLVALAQNYDANLSALGDPRLKWARGDFNYDGLVNFQDLVVLAQNYGQSLPSEPLPGAAIDFQADFTAAFAASAPEPAFLGIILLPALALLSRRNTPLK